MSVAIRVLPVLLLASGLAVAQDPSGLDDIPDDYPMDVAENVSYGYAQVLRADEVVERVDEWVPEPRCDVPEPERDGMTTGGTVIGAVVGAALGNQVGKGDGRTLATVAGAVAGGMIGNRIARDQGAQDPGQDCEMVDVQRERINVVGYDVEYMYKGEKYMSRLPYDPGNRLRVRVSVTPEAMDEGVP